MEAYESLRSLHRKSHEIANLSAAVNWLSRTYATNIEIECAFTSLRELRQKLGELETKYATRRLNALKSVSMFTRRTRGLLCI